MTAGSREGVGAVLRAFKEILVDHLQGELDAIALERGTDPLPAPSSTTGYALSRVPKQASSPSIRIFADRGDVIRELHNLGAPRRRVEIIRIVVRYGEALDLAETEDAVLQYAQAIQTLIYQYWRPYNGSDVCLQDVFPSSDERAASLRERYSNDGWTTEGGRSTTARDEEDDIEVACIQSIYSPISFTKA
jgi:hypothetical protein